ncbi:hypothetical protein [Labilibaculum euxinus]|uniref:Uncharacterized protein n=1 Tax=Labilibaculum euxinus TaxID=2686357 RepID=A0A7M4D7Z0_9BACT|nr:hypothetical protein [Labilibaculum euxinus]MUP38769.1 hypothetical protein [Labilibaculum euxinus]MVB07974.1 hypothetical protein [Labilibaculum euxinus]
MKRNIFKYTIVLFLGITLFSCDDFNQDINYYDSVKLDLSAQKFTVLDSELPTIIDFVSESKVVTDVVVLKDGVSLYTGTASNNTFSFTLLRSDLGLNKIGDSQRIYVNATVDGKVKEMYTTISMTSASSIKDPFYMDVDDGEDIEVADPIYELSSVVKNITYKVSPKAATVGNVTAAVKVGEAGTWSNLWSKPYNASDLNIGVKGSDYAKGDTVFVQLVASVGTFRDTVSTSFMVDEYLLGDVAEVKVNVAKPGYDLIEGSDVDVTSPTCMIEFTNDFAQLNQGITTLNSTGLVLITDENLMEEGNLPLLKAAYDAGTPETVIDNVTVGDKYIVKTTRASKDYYGTLKITATNETRVEADDFVSFDAVVEEYDVEK